MNDSVNAVHSNNAAPPGAIPDEDLSYVAGVRNGDMDAFEALVKKYEGKVFNIASHMLENSEDANDASQEVFIRVFRSLSGFRGDSKFSTWLYRVANNVCLDYLRKRNHRIFSLDGDFDMDDGGGGRAASDIPDGFDVEAAAEKAEFRSLVRKAVKRLPDRHRAMIVMRDMQDLSYAEISELLGLPEGTVKSRISRARENLRGIFLEFKELKDYINVK